MEQIADISELCRVCLDSQARELIPFDKKLYYTHHSIVDIIHFCTGVLYDNSEEENILPKHLCKPCLQQMKTAFDLKTKCIESDKYLSSILCSTVSNISPQELSGISINGASHSMEYYEESVAEDDDSTDGNINDMSMQEEETKHLTKYKGSIDKSKKQKPRNMKSGGTSTCNICNKTFTYIKSYKRHMKNHKEEAYYSEANVVPYGDSVKDSYQQARSRSPSLEIVPEFDAIPEVYKITPDSDSDDDSDDDDDLSHNSTPKQFASKNGKAAKTKHRCNICKKVFTSPVFLGNHKRRVHK